MPYFGTTSKRRLGTCDERLQALCYRVVETYDCSVLEGHRGKERQDYYFNSSPQRSKVPWPKGMHNSYPSLAVDLAPWPIDWDDTNRFYHFSGFVQATAVEMSIPIRWGGDWNKNYVLGDQDFFDLVHFELDLPEGK